MQRDYIIKLVSPYTDKPAALVDVLIAEGVINEYYGNQEVGAVVETFKKAFGTTATSRFDRYAAGRLSKKHGADKVSDVIKALALLSDRQFAPTVNSVSELERKWPGVLKFINSQRAEEIGEL